MRPQALAQAGGIGRLRSVALFSLALLTAGAPAARAQLLIVGNDEKVWWDESGKQQNHAPGNDTVDIFDLRANPASPKLLASLPVPNSIVGPPVNLAITPNGEVALVASSIASTQQGTSWKPGPDDKVYVIDLKAKPPRQVAALTVGKQPSGLAINPAGDLALVANRADNSISVLAIDGTNVTVAATIPMGDSVAGVAITPDGRHALAIKPTVDKVAWLAIDGRQVTYLGYDMVVGSFPYNVAVAPGGKIALVNDNGAGGSADGNVDTVAVIDLEESPPRVVDFLVIGDGPEGLAISPRGNVAVSVLLRGANADHKAFFYHKNSALAVLKINGKRVTKVSEVEVGGLAEGVGFSPDGNHLYVGNFMDGDMSVLKVDGSKLVALGRVKLSGHPASLRVSPR
jgi:DNA-binding beta-propeller fold protein YncE